jgi:hypothetical protein
VAVEAEIVLGGEADQDSRVDLRGIGVFAEETTIPAK